MYEAAMTTDARSIYVAALKSTHALELQALQIMERQVERLKNYPEMEAALRAHIEETHGQRGRLEDALTKLGEGPSVIKEGVLGFVGNMMALGHTPAQDEILKNAFANQAFENFEIAAYRSLIVIAQQAGGASQLAAFEQSLGEEEAMSKTVAELIVPTTQKYMALTLAGEKADR
jgi:ferritin-like metal-binding protein YciE